MKRIVTILLIITSWTFSLKAQQIPLDTLIDIKFDAVPLKEVLSEIAQSQGIRFSYSDSKLPTERLITCSYTDIKLIDFLRDLFHRNEINFNIIEDQIVLYPFDINQTSKLKGKIIDQADGSPIPYANIALQGTASGTSSNEEGDFEIELSKLPSELLISHLTHEKKSIYIYDETREPVIELIPAETILQNITIEGKGKKISPYKLVKRAFNRLGKTGSEAEYGKAFYRQKSKREGRYTEIFEMFYDVKYSADGIRDWAVQEGRYAFQNDNEYDIFLYNKNFTLLSRMFPVRQPDTDSYLLPVNQDVKKLFDLNLREIIKSDDRLIAVIDYIPKDIVTLPAAKGELYIDTDNYEILKMKGTITDPSLEIIGFSDPNSSWNNYQLDFQVSFKEDLQTGHLLMDYIQIEHTFDYYFKNQSIGNIVTSSLLSFYEHYTPVRNKRLGGAIDFKKADMEVIDGLGYNPEFWHQNPIVRRTPPEEKLIKDFDKNEAFGVVFLNNDEEVVLLPDKKNSAKAKQIIAGYESRFENNAQNLIFLLTGGDFYSPGDLMDFTGYVLDKQTLKPSSLGSVLTINLYNDKNQLILSNQFDINRGHAYGELQIPDTILPGRYLLKAHTNISGEQTFKKSIGIGYQLRDVSVKAVNLTSLRDGELHIKFYPESGTMLYGLQNKIVFKAETAEGIPAVGSLKLIDQSGRTLNNTETNDLGIGMFEFTPFGGSSYYLTDVELKNFQKIKLPEAQSKGLTINIDDDRYRNIRAVLNQTPALPKEIYLLSAAQGKVYSIYEKQLSGAKAIIDLPAGHLPGGVNTLIATDKSGKILAERSFFIPPPMLNIELVEATFKSKRSNRIVMTLKVTDRDGLPVKAHLTAFC